MTYRIMVRKLNAGCRCVKEDKKKINKSFGDWRRCEGPSLGIATIAAKTEWLIHIMLYHLVSIPSN
jgi:hypothetical protein